MKQMYALIAVLGLVAVLVTPRLAGAEEQGIQKQEREQVQEKDMKQERTTGSQLMTPEERREHRREMRSKTKKEREAHRRKHHEKMKQRAKEQGKTIPDQPPEGGMGGDGMGPGGGGGMGPGGGPNR